MKVVSGLEELLSKEDFIALVILCFSSLVKLLLLIICGLRAIKTKFKYTNQRVGYDKAHCKPFVLPIPEQWVFGHTL